MKFPMILTHRSNSHAQIVVANEEQLAAAPEDYLPPVTSAVASPSLFEVSDAMQRANRAEENAALDERSQALDKAVDQFTAHVQAETAKLDAARAQIEQERATLAQQTSALSEKQDALARERAEFETQKNMAQMSAAGAVAPPGDAGTSPAAPAKRTRAAGAKEGV